MCVLRGSFVFHCVATRDGLFDNQIVNKNLLLTKEFTKIDKNLAKFWTRVPECRFVGLPDVILLYSRQHLYAYSTDMTRGTIRHTSCAGGRHNMPPPPAS